VVTLPISLFPRVAVSKDKDSAIGFKERENNRRTSFVIMGGSLNCVVDVTMYLYGLVTPRDDDGSPTEGLKRVDSIPGLRACD